ncbi:MAG: DUF3108 domain-containing protein [Gammaproteobacteria bacterium]|nr:DUF3108 domain-containing protein [Gammaproteobacteria bacterium]MDH4255597.1 DUF3108 domain-containing protein [Gammaproteobacteria bacterium]MDH5310989.1 DUF3108 domain-containing protein [Gammaproteobacteria bacterium]
MNRLVAKLVLSFAALCAAPAYSAVESLAPHTAEYRIKISVLSGTMRTVVDQTAAGFSATSVITPNGMAKLLVNGVIEERSEFEENDEGVRPLAYSSNDTLSKEDKSMNFSFDWDRLEIAGTINDEDFVFKLDGEAHDRVSIQYELMHDLLNGREARDYAIVDGEELKELTVTNIGTQRVKVPFGEFDAIGIQHQARNSSRISTLWCVRELGYLPVLIEQHRRGKLRLRAELTDYVPADERGSVRASQ